MPLAFLGQLLALSGEPLTFRGGLLSLLGDVLPLRGYSLDSLATRASSLGALIGL